MESKVVKLCLNTGWVFFKNYIYIYTNLSVDQIYRSLTIISCPTSLPKFTLLYPHSILSHTLNSNSPIIFNMNFNYITQFSLYFIYPLFLFILLKLN